MKANFAILGSISFMTAVVVMAILGLVMVGYLVLIGVLRLMLRTPAAVGVAQMLSYIDFLTARGVVMLVGGGVLIVVGLQGRYIVEALTLGVFVVGMVVIGLVGMILLRVVVEFSRKGLKLQLATTRIEEGGNLRFSDVKVPVVSGLMFLLPTTVTVRVPKEMGESVVLELNRDFVSRKGLSLQGSRRGIYRVGPMSVTATDLLGAVKMSVVCNKVFEVKVVPKHEVLDEVLMTRWVRHFREDFQKKQIINDENYHEVREYAPGDDVRRVDWKLSARSAELMVRKPEVANFSILAEVLVVVDNRFPVGYSLNRIYKEMLDRQAEVAATIGVSYLTRRAKVRLMYWDGYGWKLEQPESVEQYLEMLAEIEVRQGLGSRGLEVDKAPMMWVRNSASETEPVVKLWQERQLAGSVVVEAMSFMSKTEGDSGVSLTRLVLSDVYMEPRKTRQKRDSVAGYARLKEWWGKNRLPYDIVVGKYTPLAQVLRTRRI